MLNLYRRFLTYAASIQAPLHDAFSGPSIKGSHSITWTPESHRAFDECKVSLSRASLLAHPNPAAPLALVTDASTSAMGDVQQQRVDNIRQSLAFFSKKLSLAQKKYSAYDRELLSIYEAVKHFRHTMKAHNFIIFTDHKPITYAFQQKRDKCSSWQFNHLDFSPSLPLTYATSLDNTTLSPMLSFSRRIRHCSNIPQRTGRIAGH
jgi:cleavage and polyadenylation specificity factor subunit 1